MKKKESRPEFTAVHWMLYLYKYLWMFLAFDVHGVDDGGGSGRHSDSPPSMLQVFPEQGSIWSLLNTKTLQRCVMVGGLLWKKKKKETGISPRDALCQWTLSSLLYKRINVWMISLTL